MSRPLDVRPDLQGIAAYAAPQADAPVRLNTNECPWPPPESVLREIGARLRSSALNRYPDRDAIRLRELLGERAGWSAGGVWVANGSNEILQTLLLAFGGPERSVLLFEPTYAMHGHIAQVTGTRVIAKDVPEPWALDANEVAWTVSFEPPSITFLCSPNNPTGGACSNEVVEAALASGPGLVVVDEAYGEFSSQTALPLLAAEERLVIVRSFSKSWRLAGARVGYMLAHPWLVEAIQVARLPYHLSTPTQVVAEVAVEHATEVLSTVAEIVAERDRLAKELQRVPGVEVFPSEANFLLFRTEWPGGDLWRAMAGRGVLVRDFSAMIPGALRVTVGTSDQNATFVETLREVLSDG
ncbi:MAG TPA: histidinol-phosphate transaminase [Actinomycetota bacterium]